jgi:hypothetical protein
MKHAAKKILVSALVLGLSGGVYAQAWAAAGRAEPMPAAPTGRE